MSSAEAADAATEAGFPLIWANSNADLSSLAHRSRRAPDFIAEQASIAQFLDRDTRPDFASTVMIPALQTFIGDPDDTDGWTS